MTSRHSPKWSRTSLVTAENSVDGLTMFMHQLSTAALLVLERSVEVTTCKNTPRACDSIDFSLNPAAGFGEKMVALFRRSLSAWQPAGPNP